jgi:hypothetical protein
MMMMWVPGLSLTEQLGDRALLREHVLCEVVMPESKAGQL